MPTIVHFEIPSDNIERSKKFYSELFGWNIEKVPADQLPEGAEAWRINTKDHEGSRGVNGGIHKRMSPEQQGITNFVDVKSVDEYSDKVKQFGGGSSSSKNGSSKDGLYGCMLRHREQYIRIMAE
jgi:uncharacterized protein